MKQTTIDLPVLALVAGTRAAGGAGIGLLLSDRLPRSQRKILGWTLFMVGALTTIPLVMEVLGKREPGPEAEPDLRMTV